MPNAQPFSHVSPEIALAEPPAPIRRAWLLLGALFFGLYAFATVTGRGDVWGLHSLAFFPWPVRIAGLLFCLALLWPPLQRRAAAALQGALRPLLAAGPGRWLPLAVGLVAFLVFYSFPIRTTVFGDTRTILHAWGDNTELPLAWLPRLVDLQPLGSREILSLMLHRTVAHVLAIPIEQSYRIVSSLSGALCLALWTQFVRSEFARSPWGPLLLLVGLALGSLQIFFGHVENYAFVFLIALAFLLTGSLALDGRGSFWVAALLFVLGFKAHAVTLYFLPVFLFLLAWRLARRVPALQVLRTWRGLGFALVLPSLVVAVLLYLCYFRSFDSPRTAVAAALSQTFLPVIPPPPPLDYSLFSADHLLDLGNVVLLVGAPVVIVLLGILLLHRRAIDWRHPRVMFATLALAYPLVFYAALNPLLSMVRDWDLYALLGAPLLLFLATLLAHSEESAIPRGAAYGTALAFGVFSLGFFAVNASPARLSWRLEGMGEHAFRTYHENASLILVSAQAMESDSNRALARRLATVRRLAPSVVGPDPQYTHLLMVLASSYRERGERREAVRWVEEASRNSPEDASLALWMADYQLWAGETGRAAETVESVLRREPANPNALVLGAIAASRRRDYAGALRYLERARTVEPELAALVEQVRREAAR